MNLPLLIGIVIAYLLIMSGLAYLGNKQTRTAEDYLVAGRRAHLVVMALSYGATFISTSAIIGFGGAAALYGFGMLWLAFLNIFVGIFVACAAVGVRLRRMASNLGATTFPTLLGERYQSRWITAFSGLMIFLFMPAYTSIVLIGGGRFLQETLKVDFNVGLMLLALIVGLYVVTGGLKAVLYTDAFCALVMMVGMVFLLFKSYFVVGGRAEWTRRAVGDAGSGAGGPGGAGASGVDGHARVRVAPLVDTGQHPDHGRGHRRPGPAPAGDAIHDREGQPFPVPGGVDRRRVYVFYDRYRLHGGSPQQPLFP